MPGKYSFSEYLFFEVDKMRVPKIDKFFNTAGPTQIDIHYTLDPLRRINYYEISRLIGQRSYFVLHAPRQTGKTTSLLAMVKV